MKIGRKSSFMLFLGAAALLLTCGDNGVGPWTVDDYVCADNGFTDALDRGRDDLGLPDAIVIKYNGNDDATVIRPSNQEIQLNITVNGGHVAIETYPRTASPLNIVVSGTTKNGSLKVSGIATLAGLYLSGADITNLRGPAINLQTSQGLPVHLVGGCGRENYLSDGGASYETVPGEDAKGAFFSEKRLTFQGSGYLEVSASGYRSNGQPAHAIVVDNDLRIESGNITIRESGGDGIHANDDIRITGGTIQVLSVGDAIQNEVAGQTISISSATVRLQTTGEKSHGIACEDSTIIDGLADVKIYVSGNGAKGIRTRGFMGMRGGTLDITATGTRSIDRTFIPTDTSNAAGIKVGSDSDNSYGSGDMVISGGTLTVNARSAKYARGLNIDGSLTVSGGKTDIKADNDGIRTRGNFTMTGGTLKARSTDGQDIDCRGTFTPSSIKLDAPNRREGAEQ